MTWKNATFLVGFSWLIYGALFLDYPDWDIGVSIVMAVSTYFSADVVWRLLITKFKGSGVFGFTWATFFTWFSVDGSYWMYWTIINPSVMIREGQWPMSLCLFLLCGATWSLVPAQQSLLDTAKLGLQLVKAWWSRTFANNS